MTKIGALIPIRLGSSRLPGKAIMNIEGRPAVYHLLDRCFASKYLVRENVVVCTTTEATDDQLVPVIEATGARIFRGSRDDLIDRMHAATTKHGFDVIVEVDGDDICTDTLYIDLCIEKLLSDPTLDVVYAEGLPLGLSARVFRAKALAEVHRIYIPGTNDTGFMYYLTKSGLFPVGTIFPISKEHTNDRARLTLDYQQDLDLFRMIFKILYEPGSVFGVADICKLFADKPHLLALNENLGEEYWQRTSNLVKEGGLQFRTADGIVRIEG